MRKQLIKVLGLLIYLILLSFLFNFNWLFILKPKPFFSVLIGMILLTGSQYKPDYTKEDWTVSLKWNLIFSSFLTTLASLLSSSSTIKDPHRMGWAILEALLPMIYGSLLYLIVHMLFNEPIKKIPMDSESDSSLYIDYLSDPNFTQKIFIKYGLTNRECHVALKLLESISNKEIAEQLYISEGTVKKHIQSIYQKFGATDRLSYKEIYIKSAEKEEKKH